MPSSRTHLFFSSIFFALTLLSLFACNQRKSASTPDGVLETGSPPRFSPRQLGLWSPDNIPWLLEESEGLNRVSPTVEEAYESDPVERLWKNGPFARSPLRPHGRGLDGSPNGGIVERHTRVNQVDDFDQGFVSSTAGTSDDIPHKAMMYDKSSKIVFVGKTYDGTDDDFFIGRLHWDGSWDTTFSSDGRQVTDISSGSADLAHGIALVTEAGSTGEWQTGGAYIVAGRYYNGTNYDWAITRYKTEGTLDTNFGTSGKKTHTVKANHDFARDVVVVTTFGHFQVAGYANISGSDYDFAVGYYDSKGGLDTRWGTSGVFTQSVSGSNDDSAVAVAARTDLTFSSAVGGTYNGTNWDIAIMSFNTISSNSTQYLDTVFSSDGIAFTTLAGGDDFLWDVIYDSTKMVAAGEVYNGTAKNLLIVRYTNAGALDTTFDSDGWASYTGDNTGDVSVGTSISIDSTGNYLVGGYFKDSASGDTDFLVARFKTNGALDTTFSTDGVATVDLDLEETSFGMGNHGDSLIYVLGRSYDGTDYDFAVARFDSGGTVAKPGIIDPSFGYVLKDVTAGTENIAWGAALSFRVTAAIDYNADTYGVVAGGHTYNGTNDDWALVRYKHDGGIDNSWGTSGVKTHTVAAGADRILGMYSKQRDSAATTDPSAVFGVGYYYSGTDNNMAVGLYKTDGTVTLVLKMTSFPTGADVGYAGVMGTDGGLWVFGSAYNGTNLDFAVFKMTSVDGLDTAFGSGARKLQTGGAGADELFAAVTDGNGLLVTAGYVYNGTNDDIAVVRWTKVGALDTAFSSDGIYYTTLKGGAERLYSVAVQSDNKPVAVGYVNDGTENNFLIVRYTNAGALDTTFDTDGWIEFTNFGTATNSYARSVLIQPNGSIVAGGYADVASQGTNAAIVRLLTDGTLDTTFNAGTGYFINSIGGGTSNDQIYAMAFQSDGRIVAVGEANNGTDTDFALIRVWP